MRIYDISLTTSPNLPVWPGGPKIVLERVRKIEEARSLEDVTVKRIGEDIVIEGYLRSSTK